jgi:hypothetical protein
MDEKSSAKLLFHGRYELGESKRFPKMDEKEGAKFDQSVSELRDTVPPMLWSFYQSCLSEGFTVPQSMELTIKMLDMFIHNAK